MLKNLNKKKILHSNTINLNNDNGKLMNFLYTGIIIILFVSNTFASSSEGLIAYYNFDTISGNYIADMSNNKNDCKIHGNPKIVKGNYGSAIEFDGDDDYLECTSNSMQTSTLPYTVMLWFYPKTLQGGLVGWYSGTRWVDLRLILAFDTYNGRCRYVGCVSDGNKSNIFYESTSLKTNEWIHYAVTFDGKNICLYENGLLEKSFTPDILPETENIPLLIGRCLGLGKGFFNGMIDEVRIHNQVLPHREIYEVYKQDAKKRGHAKKCLSKVTFKLRKYHDAGKVVANLDGYANHLSQLFTPGENIQVDLYKSDSQTPVLSERISNVKASPREGIFDMQKLPVGNYAIHANVIGSDGPFIGCESVLNFFWEGQTEKFKGIKILNNFVWELLNINETPGIKTPDKYVIDNPFDRWVFISTTAKTSKGSELWVSIDSHLKRDAVIQYSNEERNNKDAMKFLPAGKHILFIGCNGNAALQRIIVRSIPVLQYGFFDAQPHIKPYGPYDWNFLSKDILPNVNVIMTCTTTDVSSYLNEWKATGRSWIHKATVPNIVNGSEDAVNEIYQFWANNEGLKNPLMDGIIVDEFSGGNDLVYDLYQKAVKKIYDSPDFKRKAFLPYGGRFDGKDRSTQFAKACIDGGGYVCWERYLPEQPTQDKALSDIKASIVKEFPLWEDAIPGITQKMIIVLGCMSQPTASLNINPLVNFKVFMDMQMRLLATHPASFGLGGLQWWHSSYCDEENLRWIGKLYRHYCIEGNTEPLSIDPYELTHTENPDFADGVSSWAIFPAEAGSIKQIEYDGYSWLQGRHPKTDKGNTFLWMKRSGNRPNVFNQYIKDLTPERLYSLKMITADYQDLIHERSARNNHAISIRISNAEILSEAKNAFQYPFPNNHSHSLGKFNREYPYYMNYHWRVFRAKERTAKLKIMDWESDTKPGGPVRQELMYNFIEIQPYLESACVGEALVTP